MNKYSDKKIVWFPEKLGSFISGDVTAPIYVRIKPTNRCSHSCSWCIYRPEFADMHDTCNNKDEIPTDKLIEILVDLHEIGVKAVTFSGGGEPLLHPGIERAMEFCIGNSLNYSFITNGQNMKGMVAGLMAYASWIRVSMDYWDEESFVKSRGISGKFFTQIIQNISHMSTIKDKECDLGVNFIVTKENYRHLEEVVRLLKAIGVENVRFSPLWTKEFKEYHFLISSEVKWKIKECLTLQTDTFKVYSSYNLDHLSERPYTKCYMNQVVPVIGADLNIYTCHNGAYQPNHIIGSIKDKLFSEVWFSPETRELFNAFDPCTTCNNMQCASDNKNILIRDILDCKNDNFI